MTPDEALAELMQLRREIEEIEASRVRRRPRVMREVELSQPVSLWLESLGCTVYSEVDCGMSTIIDHVGIRSDKSIVCVQLKCSLNEQVIRQACLCQLATAEVYAAVKTKPRQSSIDRAVKIGIGVWVAGRVACDPHPRWEHRALGNRYRDMVLEACARLTPGGVGGLPTLAGDGPAIRCAAACAEYLKVHPRADWKELWQHVPNHYKHHRSMRGALGPMELLGVTRLEEVTYP